MSTVCLMEQGQTLCMALQYSLLQFFEVYVMRYPAPADNASGPQRDLLTDCVVRKGLHALCKRLWSQPPTSP